MAIPDLHPYTLKGAPPEDSLFAKPFTLVGVKRTVWNVACDRAWLVGIQGDPMFERWQGKGEHLSAMLGYLQTKATNPHRVDVLRLNEWLGNPKKDELGRICNAVLSLDRVAMLLKLVPSDQVQLWDASALAQDQPCLGMQEGNFRAMLMGHDPKARTTKAVKREFDPRPAEMNAFDLAMSLDNG